MASTCARAKCRREEAGPRAHAASCTNTASRNALGPRQSTQLCTPVGVLLVTASAVGLGRVQLPRQSRDEEKTSGGERTGTGHGGSRRAARCAACRAAGLRTRHGPDSSARLSRPLGPPCAAGPTGPPTHLVSVSTFSTIQIPRSATFFHPLENQIELQPTLPRYCLNIVSRVCTLPVSVPPGRVFASGVSSSSVSNFSIAETDSPYRLRERLFSFLLNLSSPRAMRSRVTGRGQLDRAG